MQLYTESQVRSTLARLLESRPELDPRRGERAIKIILTGEIHKLPSGNYAVKSHSINQPVEYAVNPRYDSCNCPDSAQGFTCKHRISYYLLKNLESQPKTFANVDELIAYCTT